MPYSEETASYKVRYFAYFGGFWRSYSPRQFNHTMLRIKDPKVSIPFYTDASSSFTLPSLHLNFVSAPFCNQVIGMDLIESERNHILRLISDSLDPRSIALTNLG
jgi:hypothetical protein